MAAPQMPLFHGPQLPHPLPSKKMPLQAPHELEVVAGEQFLLIEDHKVVEVGGALALNGALGVQGIGEQSAGVAVGMGGGGGEGEEMRRVRAPCPAWPGSRQ